MFIDMQCYDFRRLCLTEIVMGKQYCNPISLISHVLTFAPFPNKHPVVGVIATEIIVVELGISYIHIQCFNRYGEK